MAAGGAGAPAGDAGGRVSRNQIASHDFGPSAHVSALVNPSNVRDATVALADLETAARARGMEIQVLNDSTNREIDDAFATFLRQRPDALFGGGDGLFTSRRVQLVLLAMLHKVPAIFANREFAEIGGLMSYGANVPDAWHQVG